MAFICLSFFRVNGQSQGGGQISGAPSSGCPPSTNSVYSFSYSGAPGDNLCSEPSWNVVPAEAGSLTVNAWNSVSVTWYATGYLRVDYCEFIFATQTTESRYDQEYFAMASYAAAGTISSQGATTLCGSGDADFTVSGNSGPVTWQKCTSGNACGINNDTGWSAAASSNPGLTTTTKFRTKVVGCGTSYSNVILITVEQPPTPAAAGPDQTDLLTCGLTTVTLAGNTPTIGTGSWEVISGSMGSLGDASSPTSTFSGMVGSTYTLRWMIRNSYCVSSDFMIVTFNSGPTTAIAGPDQVDSFTCGINAVTLAANTPEVGTGSWSIISGTGGSLGNAAIPTSTFSGTLGSTYTLRWMISNGVCISSDLMVVKFNRNSTTANAGPDQTGSSTCGLTTVTLAANIPEVGTGSWSIINGTGGSFANQSSPTSTFSGTAGTAYTLRWTINNDPCPPSSDDVAIKFNLNPALEASMDYSQYMCAVKFVTTKLDNCLTIYNWNFGDGTTSLERNPLHVYATPGTYNVSVLITYNCSPCQGNTTLTKQVVFSTPSDILQDRAVQVVTDIKQQVISTEASTFSDAWPLNHISNNLDNRNSFVNGSQGVWRNNASFVYRKDRKFSDPPDIATDGTFTLEQFNWNYAELNAVPNWIKANSMTRYSPFSFELENLDVQGIYSAAIYDYDGQLPAANGVNMRTDEMAFTSFEHQEGGVAGNWIISNGALAKHVVYKINAAYKNMAIVEASLSQLNNVTEVDVTTDKSYFNIQGFSKPYTRNEIVCKQAHPQNPQWSIIVLKTSPYEGVWMGKLQIKDLVTLTGLSIFDAALAHTGNYSLKINQVQVFKQSLLRLDPGKSYWVNGWVSVNNSFVSTPVLATNLGVDIIAMTQSAQTLSTFSFQPSGAVIEGWQQLRGSFICPPNTAYIEIRFKPGSTGTAWYDDLRLHPENGNMKGYVYNIENFRLEAVLDEENFASYFYYDKEGNLHVTKKETKDGVKTLSENVSYQVEREP